MSRYPEQGDNELLFYDNELRADEGKLVLRYRWQEQTRDRPADFEVAVVFEREDAESERRNILLENVPPMEDLEHLVDAPADATLFRIPTTRRLD